MYLDELADSLEDSTGKRFAPSTIWRSLRNSGYSMKKVWSVLRLSRACLCSLASLRDSLSILAHSPSN